MTNKQAAKFGSYHPQDVVFLLKDLSHISIEKETTEREKAIQSGVHYSEMLPVEYKPSSQYLDVFHQSLEKYKQRVAEAAGVVAERMLQKKGKNLVLVSLARAGTPIGILIKRYIAYRYGDDLPHYSISIIRDRGIDTNALRYIREKHPKSHIQFIDGWTGKGAITNELTKACRQLKEQEKIILDDELAVLADPGYCSSLYGTREDFLIPSAALNSTVSGLVSRTILNDNYIHEGDFHGAKYYNELQNEDVSNYYIETISKQFQHVGERVHDRLISDSVTEPDWSGMETIRAIQADFEIDNYHFIKPGVGETTRVLLRRVPWKVLVKRMDNPDLEHILILANERGVQVEQYEQMTYECCGLIKPMG
ncbi:cysteine protease StiP family protein [Bacillus tianshenii]|nr:cysteine protease StiP family protein [Bacillus tianshenii]